MKKMFALHTRTELKAIVRGEQAAIDIRNDTADFCDCHISRVHQNVRPLSDMFSMDGWGVIDSQNHWIPLRKYALTLEEL